LWDYARRQEDEHQQRPLLVVGAGARNHAQRLRQAALYYDQSHFSNQFVRHRGLPPSQYRTKYAQEQELESDPLLSEAERARISSNNVRPGSKSKLG
jgi:AraC-like DNA-binding protein